MTDLHRRLATVVVPFAVAAGLALGVPEVASAHPSTSAIAAAATAAGAAHRVPRLKRLRRRDDRRG